MDSGTWSAIGALGQWAAAAATVGAILVALGTNRPRIRVEANLVGPPGHGRLLIVSATNIGHEPVSIQWVGFENPRGYLDVLFDYPHGLVAPIRLFPQSTASLSMTNDLWLGLGLRWPEQAFVWDVAGRRYRCSCGLRVRLCRAFYLRQRRRGPAKLARKENNAPFLHVPSQNLWQDGEEVTS